jgi:undecaprenyl-diphosphatase
MITRMANQTGLSMNRGLTIRAPLPFARLDAWEAGICMRCNALARNSAVRHYFATVSRLGDGVLWYTLLALLPLGFGAAARYASLHMGITALVGVLIYRLAKGTLTRERPFASHRGVTALTAPLDRYSFPSGHTLHAVAFTLMLAHYLPVLLIAVLPFTISVALSRVVLGLHYPTDVLAGAIVGSLLAWASLLVAGAPIL